MSRSCSLERMVRRLRAMREGLGMTAKEFAALCGVSVFTINSWETGRLNPSAARCVEITRRILSEDTVETVIMGLVADYESNLRVRLKAPNGRRSPTGSGSDDLQRGESK